MGNNPISGVLNSLGRTVILLETNRLCVFKVLSKPLNIFNFSAAPTVNGLIVITDSNYWDRTPRQHPQPGVLNRVRVLEFIDQ